MSQVPHRISSALRRLLHRDDGDTGSSGEEPEAELHLYIVSQTSRFYLQLRSSWNRFVIVKRTELRYTQFVKFIV